MSDLPLNSLEESLFLRACRRKPTPHPPIWLMRQAGRYMEDYRKLREKVSFLELCTTPTLCAEAAVTAAQRIHADAAILFSDILLILRPMGLNLEYSEGHGPRIHNPIRTLENIRDLQEPHPEETLSYVYEAVRQTRAALPANLPLIGFCGAPFTVAAYAIEGGGSKNFEHTKALMYSQPKAWNQLLAKISQALSAYCNEQIRAGAQAIQIFDSWAGILGPADYRQYVLAHSRSLIQSLRKETPVIHFGTGSGELPELLREAGGDVIGLDYRVDLADTWEKLGDVGVQGNLDPVVLLTNPEVIREKTLEILQQTKDRAGHIFNLGHGVLPSTPVENVLALVQTVHELRS